MSATWKSLLGFVCLTTLLCAAYSFQPEQSLDNVKDSNNNPLVDQSQSATENTTDYRLPDYVIPTEYFIHINPFLTAGNFTFDGVVRIVANIIKSTSTIVLHADQLVIHSANVFKVNENNTKSTGLTVKDVTKTGKYEFLNLIMSTPITAGSKVSIEIAYTGLVIAEQGGLYRRQYKINNETRWLVGTHLAATSARRVIPCFDEPGFKAEFQVNIVAPNNYVALSNMPVKSVKGNVFEFEKTPPMPTYLLAIVVSDFRNLALNDGKHLYRVWTDYEKTYQLPYALSVMSKAVNFFESRLNVSYALPKLDVVAMPDYLLAMENWGLLIFRENLVLYDASVTPFKLKRYIRNALTHEIAHQWFGNLVTPKSWDFLWLSEAFATYFEYHAHEDALKSWNLESQFVVNEMQPSFAKDALLKTKPATRHVYSPIEIFSIFDTVTYTKGASLIRMLEKVLGSKIFFGALRRYLQTNRYKTGTPDLLNSAFEEELNFNNYKLSVSFSSFLNSWTTQPGLPVVDVQFNGSIAELSQKRFLLKSTENVTDNPTWVIPINWATQSNPNFNEINIATWLTKERESVTVNSASEDWVILNAQQIGYYRVNYDKKMWERIVKVLKSKNYHVIHEINRASLIDDLLNLGRAGLINYDTVLSATQYLAQETSYMPWRAAFEGLYYLKNRFTGHPEIYDAFKNYVISLIEPNYRRLGFDDITGESPLDVLLRDHVLNWLCALGHKECVMKALQGFKSFRQNSSYRVPANQQSLVYCMGIKYGSTDDWNYLWQKFKKSNNAIEKMTLLSALVCSQNSTNLERLLNNSITFESGIQQHDVEEVLSYFVSASWLGAQTTMEFIGVNYEKIRYYTGDESAALGTLSSISQVLSTKPLIDKFKSFIKRNGKNMSGIVEDLQSALDDSIYELDWYNKNSPIILEWLKKNFSNLNKSK